MQPAQGLGVGSQAPMMYPAGLYVGLASHALLRDAALMILR